MLAAASSRSASENIGRAGVRSVGQGDALIFTDRRMLEEMRCGDLVLSREFISRCMPRRD